MAGRNHVRREVLESLSAAMQFEVLSSRVVGKPENTPQLAPDSFDNAVTASAIYSSSVDVIGFDFAVAR
jgi:hypothetical protein